MPRIFTSVIKRVVAAVVTGANYKVSITPGISLNPIQSGTPAKPVIIPGIALDASRLSLVTAETVGVGLSTVTIQNPAIPLTGAGVGLSAIANYAASSHISKPAIAINRIQFDLTARRGGSTVVTSTGWVNPANAIDGTDGRANGVSATSTGSLTGNTDTLILSYPAQANRNLLTLSSVKLYFYAATSATWLVSTAAMSYSLDGGTTFTALGNIPAGAVLGTPQVFDITAAVGGSWAKIAALQIRVIVTHGAASALEVLSLDAIEDEAIASRTDIP